MFGFARFRDSGVTHVELEFEVLVVHPDRLSDVQRDALDALPVPRYLVEAGVEVCAEVLVLRCRPFEHHESADVHGLTVAFQQKEGLVEWAQAIWHRTS